jgi:hypothetical protein
MMSAIETGCTYLRQLSVVGRIDVPLRDGLHFARKPHFPRAFCSCTFIILLQLQRENLDIAYKTTILVVVVVSVLA